MKRTISIFMLITALLAKNYLIEVADEGAKEAEERGDEEGSDYSDYSLNKNFKMVLDGQFY